MLAHRLSQDEIKEICVLAHGKHNDHLKEQLYQLTLDDDRRVAVNALWALTHFASSDHEWLYAKRHHLIDRCIVEQDATKLRLLLALLLRQPFGKEDIRTDFMDYCLVRIADSKSAYAVRAQCIKLAYEQMRYWPELAKTEHSHPLGMVVSTHFRCGKWVKRGLKNGALPFNID